jgi:hypothetical protein
MRSRPETRRAALLAVVLAVVPAPSSAAAANVVNGGFESGTLNGWQVRQANGAGNWFAYRGTAAPIGSKRPIPADPVQPPPQGAFAAIADQANPDSLILYQNVALEPGLDHQLSLLAYYDSYRPIAVPAPNTLSVDDESLGLPGGKAQKNQQFRIDVIRPEAPLDSLDSADVLLTVFATNPGDPLRMAPRRLTADLGSFAGQTVRIRVASSVTEEVLNAGVDAVSIRSSPPRHLGLPGARGGPVLFSFGRVAVNRRRGTATLRVRVSGPGLLRVKGEPPSKASARRMRTKSLRGPIEPVTIPIAVARTVTVHLRPTSSARVVLRRRHRLRVEAAVTFMPLGATAETATVPLVLRFAY